MPYVYPHSDVNLDYFTENVASGGEGGSSFRFIDMNGAILRKIKAWTLDWRIRGVEVTLSDGRTQRFGLGEGDSEEFTFQTGEVITKINVQASAPYSSELKRRRLGAIWFQTNKSREFGIFSKNLEKEACYWPDVGSGLCCGIFGANGDDVDRLGFAFIRNVKQSWMTNVTYPNLNMEIVATTPDTVAQQNFSNGSSVSQSFELKGSKAVTITRSWGTSTTLTMSFEMKVTAGIPDVASVESGFSWGVSSTSTYNLSSSTTEEQSWSWPLVCPPHTKIRAKATMYADNIDTAYEADIELTLDNNKIFRYKEKGIYSGLNARAGSVEIEELGPA